MTAAPTPAKGLDAWGKLLGATAEAGEKKDRRFAAEEWSENPLFDTIRQSYLAISDRLLGSVDEIQGVDAATRQKLKFTTKSFVDAMSPSNFALTNPQVMKRTIETKGESLLTFRHASESAMASDAIEARRVRVFAIWDDPPCKVSRNALPLIQMRRDRDGVEAPVVVFPPWIKPTFTSRLTPGKLRNGRSTGLSLFLLA